MLAACESGGVREGEIFEWDSCVREIGSLEPEGPIIGEKRMSDGWVNITTSRAK